MTAVISDEKESKVLWISDSPFLFYINMETAIISSLIKEI